MEPVSAALIGPVCLLALGGVAGALVLWRRLAGPGVRAVLARSGLLLATQVTLTASIVLLANRYFVFYATWNDLLGNDPANVRVEHVQPQGAEGGLVDRTTLKRDPVEGGRIDHLKIHGIRSGVNSDAYAHLPPQYFQPAYAAEPLPVVMLIADGDPTRWLRDVPRAQPVIYVSVGVQGACMDVPGRRDGLAETYLAQDLPAAVASVYRVPRSRAGWGTAGIETGGQCAVRLAMLHSDRFAAAASLNGRFATPAGDLYGGSDGYRRSNDLMWRLQHVPPPPVSVLAAAGTGSEEAGQAERFAALAKPPMRTETSGAQKPKDVLTWLGARLRVPPGE
ncbi:hypothetical protein E1293_15915 [Actinomadura darangshiensis]|uniref:Esterase n=1 Tax=Actinomadura darangshiensis TaxID=705336 RepID=A0A4R5B9T7_9ACTN|nr:hypothetical protein [Actinomadura darangshiensis]TDD82781.1 hypothetical protein E1293_15915 [Actinomadura darangshiensis]